MSSTDGFTMIELLIVISIIGILAALIALSFTSSQRQARDTQRKSDMSQYKGALEVFASANNNYYPFSNGVVDMADLCSDKLGDYTSNCPEDPNNTGGSWPTYRYYTYNGSGIVGDATATKYLMYTGGGLESKTGSDWVVCSNGKSGVVNTTSDWDMIYSYCQ